MDIQSSLNKLADALRITISYNSGTVSGTSKLVYSPIPGLKIPVTISVLKLFASESVGILAHVVGDLYLIASTVPSTGAVNVFLIDKSKLTIGGSSVPMDLLIMRTMDIREVVKTFRKAIVTAFLWKDRKWGILKLPT